MIPRKYIRPFVADILADSEQTLSATEVWALVAHIQKQTRMCSRCDCRESELLTARPPRMSGEAAVLIGDVATVPLGLCGRCLEYER